MGFYKRKDTKFGSIRYRRRQLGADLMFERLWETVTGNGWVMEQGVARARDDCSQLQRPAAESPRDVIKCERGVASLEPLFKRITWRSGCYLRNSWRHLVHESEHVMELEDLVGKMKDAKIGPGEGEICAVTLRGLPASYESLIQAFGVSATNFSLGILCVS